MIKGKIWWVVVVVFFLTSCTANQPLSSGLATSTITKQPILPTITPKITTTQTSQPTVEAEVISPLEEIVFGDCLEVQPSLPEDVYIPWDMIGSHENKKVLFDVNQREYKFLDFFEELGLDGLPIALGYNIKISPDGKWIAYLGSYSKNNTLYLDSVQSLQNQSNENKIVLEIDRPFKLARWVDTDTLLINYIDEEAPYLYLTSFYDPFTGKEKIFSLRDYPNYLDTELGGAFIVSHYWNDGDLVPDPTMTRIIYPSLLNEPYDIKNNLWDTNEEKLVSKFDYMVSMDNQPFWALDGSDFLITTWQDKGEYNWFADWFWMSRDGDYRQITNFIEFMENNDYYFDDIGRSPDGRYIAFLITFEDNGTVFSKYIVLDIKTDEISGFCVNNSADTGSMDMPVPWSPDSRYIVLNSPVHHPKGELVIVDVDKKEAYLIKEKFNSYGWIIENGNDY